MAITTKDREAVAVVVARKNLGSILSCAGMVARAIDGDTRREPGRVEWVRNNFADIRELASPEGIAEGAMETLGRAYRRTVGALAEELAPKFKRRAFRGFTPEDAQRLAGPRSRYQPPLWKLEDVVRKRLLRTNREAMIVAALSAWTGVCVKSEEPVEALAVEAATRDVLSAAARSGWYRPRKNEEPSLAELEAGPEALARKLAARGITSAQQWLAARSKVRRAA